MTGPSKPVIPDVLASRYASGEMARIWSPEHKVVLERQLWLAVLDAQRSLGLDVPQQVVDDYRAVIDQVDLDSIAAREHVTRHDVKARIEEFCALAGHEHIHKGMTSRDLTENVEQLQVLLSLRIVRDKAVATLARLATLASEHATLVMAGRSRARVGTAGARYAKEAGKGQDPEGEACVMAKSCLSGWRRGTAARSPARSRCSRRSTALGSKMPRSRTTRSDSRSSTQPRRSPRSQRRSGTPNPVFGLWITSCGSRPSIAALSGHFGTPRRTFNRAGMRAANSARSTSRYGTRTSTPAAIDILSV